MILLIIGVVSAVIWPARGNPGVAKASMCISNSKSIAAGLSVYAADFDHHYPPASNWVVATDSYIKGREIYRCPASDSQFSYAMNEGVGAANIAQEKSPEYTVATFESTKGVINAHDKLHSFPRPGRHGEKSTVSYLDGHAKSVQTLAQKP